MGAGQGAGFTIERGVDGHVEPFIRFFCVETSGSLVLNDVTLQKGRVMRGGAILNNGTISLTGSTLTQNWGYYGGGAIASISGSVDLTYSTVSGNASSWYYDGGGISVEAGTLLLDNTTVADNASSGIGNAGNATLINSTVSGNNKPMGGIGGIWNVGTLTLTNSTVSGNGIGGGIGGTGTVTASNSIIASNHSNCNGPVADLGNNFADDDSCGPGFTPITPDVDFDTTLADNGGPTLTHALLPGSVAINAAGDCGLPTDQRGFLRWDGACDSGSFEYGATPPDADQDGVPDAVDFCLDTATPESVPTNHLQVNRWALVDDDDVFDTTSPPGGGGGPDFAFTVADTGGCSCEQIIERWALGWGHTKFGCSTGAMLQWIAYVGDYSSTQLENVPGQIAAGAIQTPMDSSDNPSASAQGTVNDPDSRRQHSLTPSRTPRPHNRN